MDQLFSGCENENTFSELFQCCLERGREKKAQKFLSILRHSLNGDYGVFLVTIFEVNAFRL
jgi:hypothetical protein